MLRALTSTTARTGSSTISGAALLRHAVELGLVIVIALILSQALWFVIYGSDALDVDVRAPSGAARASEASVLAVGDLSGVFAPVAQTAAPIAPESRLGFTLRGVRVGEAPESGSAIIDIPNDGQRLVGTGQTLSAANPLSGWVGHMLATPSPASVTFAGQPPPQATAAEALRVSSPQPRLAGRSGPNHAILPP